jgi:succinyl-CoA synthetase beta subunit
MKLHEFQAKGLFQAYDIPTTDGITVQTVEDAVKAADEIGLPLVLKAQVHVGGRGKAGGVKLVHEEGDIAPTAEAILGLTIKDLPVRKLLVTGAVNIAKEVYLSILLDRGTRTVVFIGCSEGGVEIEQTAKDTPEKILRCECKASELTDLPMDKLKAFAGQLFDDASQVEQAVVIMAKMGKLFREKDASLVEINPLIVDDKNQVVALDAKMLVDDNALFRHSDLEELRDMDCEDVDELKAKEAGLSFIRLQGNIGCMVNGAGLAMTTMDIIKHFGGAPANFLDVGGSSDPKKVVLAFETILKDPDVKGILVNIFGGITRCDDIANGLLSARKQMEINVPLVVRLVGTNSKEGLALLEGTDLIPAQTLEEGAIKAAEIGNAS